MKTESLPIEPWRPGKTAADQMLWMSSAYAEAASVLCDQLASDDFTQQYTSALVVLHLCRHATELYLKGSIGKRRGQVPKGTHRLDALYTEYLSLYPDSVDDFSSPFSEQIMKGDDGLFPGTLDAFKRTHDQRFRYPMDNTGVQFQESEWFDIKEYQAAVQAFRHSILVMLVLGRTRA